MRSLSNWLGELSQWSAAALLVDVAVKATVLILLAMLVLRLRPRASAALRHRVWCLVFCGLVALPVLCFLLPGLAVPILPSWYQEAGPVAVDQSAQSTEVVDSAADVKPRPLPRSLIDNAMYQETDSVAETTLGRPRDDQPVETAQISAVPDLTAVALRPEKDESTRLTSVFNPLAIWLIGEALCLLPLIAGLLRSAALRARARNIFDASWITLRDQLCIRLGLKRPAKLLEVDAPIIPLSCGIVRPAVVLPRSACEWNEPLRRFVLLHELSHIQRHDVVFQLIARLACALYWFHPLVWYALHRLRVERELACDDSVLAAGERPSDYAEQLLEVARRLQPLRLHAAVAMAQSNKLEHRVSLLFSRARSHLPLSTRAGRLLFACAVGIVVAVSVVRPSARATVDHAQTENKPQEQASASTNENENAKPNKIFGRVLAADDKPIKSAQVILFRVTREEADPRKQKTYVITETAADEGGRFAMRLPGTQSNSDLLVVAKASGHGLAWLQVEAGGTRKEHLLKLAPDDAPIEGSVLDLEGQPIAGVRVTARSISSSVDNIDAWITKAREEPPQRLPMARALAPLVRFPAQASLELEQPKLAIAAVTDAEGRFRLTGLGSKRLAQLELSGGGIARSLIHAVTHPTEPVPYPQRSDPRFRVPNCFGARFDVVMEPGLRVIGTVRDASTGQPLHGVEMRYQRIGTSDERGSFISTATDANGRYQLDGIPKADRAIPLVAIPSAEQPYFRTYFSLPSGGLDAQVHDIELKPAIWIRGRIVDDQTGNPVKGAIAYYPFLTNEAAKEYANFKSELSGLEGPMYATKDDGSFRIPGLTGRGILTVVAEEEGRFPLADGADAIGGLRRKSPRDPALVYLFVTADVVNAVREINPPVGAAEFEYEIRLNSFTPHKIRLIDSNGEPVAGVTVEGLTRKPGRPPVGRARDAYAAQTSAVIDVFGLNEDQPRYLKFVHADRRLVSVVRLTAEDFVGDKPKDITLFPAATITGRVVDQKGAAVAGASAVANLVDILNFPREVKTPRVISPWSYTWRDQPGPDGRFRFDLVPPNVELRIQAVDATVQGGPANPGSLRATVQAGPLKPGAQVDLGDVVMAPLPPRTSSKRPPLSASAASAGRSSSNSAANNENQPKQSESAPPEAERKSAESDVKGSPATTSTRPTDKQEPIATVRGRIIGPDGQPAKGVHVAAIARRLAVDRGAELAPNRVVLAETVADEQGRYTLTFRGASSNTHRDAYLLARAPYSALAWQKLNLDAADLEASFELKPGEVLKGRLVDIEGQPAGSVELRISAVRPAVVENRLLPGGIDFWRSTAVPAAWPAPVISDDEGRFSISGIPEGHGVYLTVEGNDRFAVQDIALNTRIIPERTKSDATDHPQVKNGKPGEETLLTVAPAQIFAGRVTDEDTGEGVPNAPLHIWASRQQVGGAMMAVSGRADANGRYRINPHAGVRFGVVAYAPAGAAYLTRRIDDIRWDSGNGVKGVDIKLPRGAIVRGTVLTEGTGKPVVGASVQYVPEDLNNPNVGDDILTGWQAIEVTDEAGRFQIVVLPGPGRLLVHGPDGAFVLRESSSGDLYRGKKGGRRVYAHAVERIEPAKRGKPLDITIHLTPGGKTKGELIDALGRSIDEALMITRLHVRTDTLGWRGSSQTVLGGRFEQGGLAPNAEYPVHFLDAKLRLGATVNLKAGDGPLRVVLRPCGEATMRFVDTSGNPLPDHNPGTRMVVTPGPLDWNRGENESELSADEDFIANIDRLNHGTLKGDADGRVTLPALIPGATYRVLTVRKGQLVIAKEFQAKSGETIDLGDIVYERQKK